MRSAGRCWMKRMGVRHQLRVNAGSRKPPVESGGFRVCHYGVPVTSHGHCSRFYADTPPLPGDTFEVHLFTRIVDSPEEIDRAVEIKNTFAK
jgi:hypothetical protein